MHGEPPDGVYDDDHGLMHATCVPRTNPALSETPRGFGLLGCLAGAKAEREDFVRSGSVRPLALNRCKMSDFHATRTFGVVSEISFVLQYYYYIHVI